MNKAISALWALLFIFCTGGQAYAQGREWEALNSEVTSLYRQGLYDPAVVAAKKALQIAEIMTVRPKRSTSAPWKSRRKPLVQIIPMWPQF